MFQSHQQFDVFRNIKIAQRFQIRRSSLIIGLDEFCKPSDIKRIIKVVPVAVVQAIVQPEHPLSQLPSNACSELKVFIFNNKIFRVFVSRLIKIIAVFAPLHVGIPGPVAFVGGAELCQCKLLLHAILVIGFFSCAVYGCRKTIYCRSAVLQFVIDIVQLS